jgi:hypothetical protein
VRIALPEIQPTQVRVLSPAQVRADEVIGEEHLWQVGENAWVVIDDRHMRAAP